MKAKIFVLMSLGLGVFASCNDEGGTNQKYIDAAVCTGVSASYATDVAPIINARCATGGCHNASSAKKGLNMQGYAAAKASFDDYAILCSINYDSGCNRMPQGSAQLSASEILTITCWAKNGFPQ